MYHYTPSHEVLLYNAKLHPKDAGGIKNIEDPDQTAPSGSAMVDRTYLTQYLGPLEV